MIIKDIRLTNFGKFNHKMVTLEPGLNIVYGENEAGKTTLHTFIRGMLFGIEKQRGKASGKDLYTKYEPWENPANYHGMMRIESDGVTYRIEILISLISLLRLLMKIRVLSLKQRRLKIFSQGLMKAVTIIL